MVESCPGRVVQQQIGAHERAQPRARTSSAASTSTPTPRTRTRSARRARRSTVSACAARSSASLTPAPSTTNSPSSTRSVPSSRRSSSSAAWTGGVSVTACRRRLVGMDPSVAPVSHRTVRPAAKCAPLPATELSTRTAGRLLPEGRAAGRLPCDRARRQEADRVVPLCSAHRRELPTAWGVPSLDPNRELGFRQRLGSDAACPAHLTPPNPESSIADHAIRHKIPANGNVFIGAPGFEPGTSPTRMMGEICGCCKKYLQIGYVPAWPHRPSEPRI